MEKLGDVNGIELPTARKYQLQISMNDDYTVNDDGELCDGYGNPVGYVKIDRYTYDGQTIKY